MLGLDDAVSMDHNWGPRLLLVLQDADHANLAGAISERLAAELPDRVSGIPTGYQAKDPSGITRLLADAPRPLNHLVEVLTLKETLERSFGPHHAARLLVSPPDTATWLALPEQGLLEWTSGQVYHDGTGMLGPLRTRLAHYPEDVRRAKMISLLHGIESEEAFPGRARSSGDTRGIRLIAARLCALTMKLCFYLENRYIPYSKWFAPVFSSLECAGLIGPAVDAVLVAEPAAIPDMLAGLYEKYLSLLSASGLAADFDPRCSDYHDRPWPVMHASRIIDALKARIADPAIRECDLRTINLGRILDGYEI